MALDEFLDLMAATVTVEPWASQDRYGKATYGTAVSYPAHIQVQTRKIVSFTGEDKVSTTTIHLGTAAEIDPRSRVTLPSGYNITQPPILAVGRHMDEVGQHHTVLYT